MKQRMTDARRVARLAGLLVGLLLALIIADAALYRVGLPVVVRVTNGQGTLLVDGQRIHLGPVGQLTGIQMVPRDSLVHEYQIDGTDSTNNFTLDTNYLATIAASPYYRFQAWMRDLEGASHWRDLRVAVDGRPVTTVAWPSDAARVALPPAPVYTISLTLQRPETPTGFALIQADGSVDQITLDRNDRTITVRRIFSGVAASQTIASVYFPRQLPPFAAMMLDFTMRVLLWAIVVLLAVMVAEAYLAIGGFLLSIRFSRAHDPENIAAGTSGTLQPEPASAIATPEHVRSGEMDRRTWLAAMIRSRALAVWRGLTAAIHPVAIVALGISLILTAWIARVQFNAEPHVYDASAYFFAARVYASGHLWVATPPAHELFPGPFMLDVGGRRFIQYPPGTGLMLALGVKLGVPWLVEPVLGTLALLATGLIAARLINRRIATIAVLLGVLSPFYTYLAASYLSHTIAFFFLAWGTWALVRFAQGEAGWNLPLAVALFGMGQLTRDEVAMLYAAIVIVGVVALSWRRLRWDWPRWITPAGASLVVALAFVALNLGYNALMTGSARLSPRQLFFPGDHWGFGQGVGFYGQHTLAAGVVNLDEILTILSIDLFGWPFYLTLALLAMPFLTRRFRPVDWLLLVGFVLMAVAFIGYFYHGIYLGPRYVYETLPFLLILSARGIETLAETGHDAGVAMRGWLARLPESRGDGGALLEGTPPDMTRDGASPTTSGRSIAADALLVGLLACSLIYYWPRQLAIYQNFTGLPVTRHVNLAEAYRPPAHNAIVVTGDYQLYEYVFFPLNDPALHGDVLYALASTPDQYAELRRDFPGRTLYQVSVAPDGTVRYTRLAP